MMTECSPLIEQAREQDRLRHEYARSRRPLVPLIGVAAINQRQQYHERLIAHLAACLKTSPEWVRAKAAEVAHDSKTMGLEEVLVAACRGQIKL